MKSSNLAAAVFLIALVSCTALTTIDSYAPLPASSETSDGGPLPRVKSEEHLRTLLIDALDEAVRNAAVSEPTMVTGLPSSAAIEERAAASPNAESAPDQATSHDTAQDAPRHSETNVQVEGVDEADLVKTDGRFIYRANPSEGTISIVEAYPGRLRRLSSIDVNADTGGGTPLEMFVDDRHLVVVSELNRSRSVKYPLGDTVEMPGRQYTVATVYDIADKGDPTKIREIEIEGHYASSRKIGSALYLVANQQLNVTREELSDETGPAIPLPSYRDSDGTKKYQGQTRALPLTDISYMPGSVEPNYVIVAGVDLDKPGEPVKLSANIGPGQNIYSSTSNLYVAAPSDSSSSIYRFALDEGRVKFTGTAIVPGTLLNQFSMDEHDGRLRVATTTAGASPEPGVDGGAPQFSSATTNNLYVLGGDLKIEGKVTGLAPGERIYSVRFMQERAYMVTFRETDPFWVIDLKNPARPKVLGELKIPGFSSYLHPYDKDHVIGFGRDGGLKMSLFDVSDVSNPKEQFKELIGGGASDSELLTNHKALLFDADKGILAFPVSVNSTGDDAGEYPEGMYTQSSWYQGAYVYDVDLEQGFRLRGKISHSPENISSPGGIWAIRRILTIEERIYGISAGAISAHSLSDIEKIDELEGD